MGDIIRLQYISKFTVYQTILHGKDKKKNIQNIKIPEQKYKGIGLFLTANALYQNIFVSL